MHLTFLQCIFQLSSWQEPDLSFLTVTTYWIYNLCGSIKIKFPVLIRNIEQYRPLRINSAQKFRSIKMQIHTTLRFVCRSLLIGIDPHWVAKIFIDPYLGSIGRPMKGVFPTPNTEPFFSSDTDIQPKVNVAWHWHSDLVARHLTLHFSLTLTVSFPMRRRTLRKNSSRCPTLGPPFMGPINAGNLIFIDSYRPV